ncbi:MAG: hypothetical protein Q4C60_01260 [Eubacteriales bacterium]|nr:hypothetical protein [Eubacteriales bacterium]
MVAGIESFREKFSEFADCYTVIGGAACDILMSEEDLDFRATKDIDMILILEDQKEAFATVFWEYIREGNYLCGWKNNPDTHFYRFTEPLPGYPVQIELFSRNPGYQLSVPEGIIPIHISDDVSSLSAILLNDEYYAFMQDGRRVIDGIPVLDVEHLVSFKMFAWLDLTRKKANGEHVNERDLKKHKNDVFRLFRIMDVNRRIIATGDVRENIIRFLDEMQNQDIRTAQFEVPYTQEEVLGFLRDIYGAY